MASLSLDKLGNTCACCAVPTVVAAVVALYVLAKIFTVTFGGQKTEATGVKKYAILTVKWVSRISFLLITVFAIFLGVLQQRPELRARFFVKILTSMTKSGHLHEERCGLVSHLSGSVLEFGPGPGTNFKCMPGLPIDKWTGVEPNSFFADVIAETKSQYNITFPTETVWLKGGDVNVEPESFDAVILTHVLCSVGEPEMVIKQAARALKPGGTFYFMEHVAAPAGTSVRYVQHLLAPFFYIVGNGCEFRETWTDILTSESLKGFDIKLKHFEADMLAPMNPHIIGSATKPIYE